MRQAEPPSLCNCHVYLALTAVTVLLIPLDVPLPHKTNTKRNQQRAQKTTVQSVEQVYRFCPAVRGHVSAQADVVIQGTEKNHTLLKIITILCGSDPHVRRCLAHSKHALRSLDNTGHGCCADWCCVPSLPGCPFDSARCFICELCRLTVVWVDCRCFLSFVFLGGARRLGHSPCNTGHAKHRLGSKTNRHHQRRQHTTARSNKVQAIAFQRSNEVLNEAPLAACVLSDATQDQEVG